MQFKFDETGGSFYYFLVSFYFLVLLPLTCFFWPKHSSQENQENNRKKCRCEACQSKQHLLNATTPNKGRRVKLIRSAFVFAWIIFFVLAYKVSQIEMEWKEYDPFSELGISKDATISEIKKAYKNIILKNHPDHGGDPEKFLKLSQAYKALTNEESRRNWIEHGNPDGPGTAQFGIALPKWIVEKKNSIWVLGVYVFVFMVLLPLIVGLWWYRTIKFNSDKILLNTTQIYFYFFNRTPNMPLKRVIMILTSSFEFKKSHNSEIIERPSDNEELPALLKLFPQINIKIKENPFAAAFSIKSRALIYAHLNRQSLPMHTLYHDKNVIIKKCPYLINEMINILAQLVMMAHQGANVNEPRLETVEYCMKLSQIIVQALPESHSPLMQLPHIDEDILRHFVSRKHNIRSIKQLIEMKEDDRRSLLRSLNEDQYRDVMVVSSNMPMIEMNCRCEVRDEDDSTITPSSLVTVTVKLVRKSLGCLLPSDYYMTSLSSSKWGLSGSNNVNNAPFVLPPPVNATKTDNMYSSMAETSNIISSQSNEPMEDEFDDSDDNNQIANDENEKDKSPPKKKPVWEKNRKKKNKSKSKKPKHSNAPKQQNGKLANTQTEEKVITKKSGDDIDLNDSEHDSDNKAIDEDDNQSCDDGNNSDTNEINDTTNNGRGDVKFDDEDKWKSFQDEVRRENSLETKARTTHLVHCPYFSGEKFEWWWLYLADRKGHTLSSVPLQICSLQNSEEIQLKFTAPDTPGQYVYTVMLRSDSYLDFDQSENIKITVKEAKTVDYKAQWTISDDENSGSDDSFDEDDDEVDNSGKNRKKKHSTLEKDNISENDDGFSSNTDYDYDD